MKVSKQKILVVADLHLCDGGPKDDFRGNEKAFEKVMDLAEKNNYKIIVLGDLFELWQCDLKRIFHYYSNLLKRLARLKAILILGNHDALIARKLTPDNTFEGIKVLPDKLIINKTLFMHGHQFDRLSFGIGNAIYFARFKIEGWLEEHIHPDIDLWIKKLMSFLVRTILTFYRKGCPENLQKKRYRKKALEYMSLSHPDINRIVIAHTHDPDYFSKEIKGAKIEYYNAGSWIDNRRDYLILDVNS